MGDKLFSIRAIKAFLKKTGAKSASKEACLELENVIRENVSQIGKLAIKNAEYSGRTSLKSEDIKEAVKEIKEANE